MSYTSDYLKLREERFKKEAEEERKKKEAEEKRKKEENERRLRELFNRDEDIAPVDPASDPEKAAMAQSLHNSFTASKGPLFSFDSTAPNRYDPNWEAKYQKQEGEDTVFTDGGDNMFGNVAATTFDTGLSILQGAGNFAEGVTDAILHGVSRVSDLVGADSVADFAKKEAQVNAVDNLFDKIRQKSGTYEYSYLGNQARNAGQGVGQVAGMVGVGSAAAAAGLSSAGVSAVARGVLGASSFGSGMSEAYQLGATDGQAVQLGVANAANEVISEMVFGGLGKGLNVLGFGKGLSSADDLLAKKLSNAAAKFIKSETGQRLLGNALEYTVKSGAEGLEEIISGFGSAMAKDFILFNGKNEKKFREILKDENLLEQFFIGTFASFVAQGGDFVDSVKNKTDFVTGLTKNEQTVVDKEVEKRIAEQEENGKKLTNKEKDKIYDDVLSDLDRGYISTDTIEETLGGDTYKSYKDTTESEDALKKELDELRQMKSGDRNDIQNDRLAELKAMNLDDTTKRDGLKKQLGDEVFGLVKDSRLAESYNERGRRSQAFQADTSKYDTKQRKVIQNAIDSGILNNTNRTHEFVDMVAKISADKGVSFDFTNNERLKESGFAIGGVTRNGFVTKDGVTINIQSAKALDSVVGHEITHVLEGTKLYDALQQAAFDYAKSKGEYDSRLASVTELYKKYDPDADPMAELTADLVGDYLFTDGDFIKNLSTKHRNVFQKIYDEIKYLCKVATAGSKEARELEKVKRAFEKAYKESGKAEGDTKYSLSDNHGKKLTKEQSEFFKDSKVRDENGNLKVMYHGSNEDFTVFDKSKARSGGTYGKGFYFTDSDSHASTYGNLYDVYLNITNPIQNGTNDITKDQLRKFVEAIAEDEDYGIDNYGYDATIDSVTDSVYGKGDFGIILDLNISCIGDMVEAIELFNKVNGTNYDGIVAPTETVAFYPEQIKLIDNKKPTRDPDIRFSLSEDIDTFDNSLYNEIELPAVERDRVQSEALTWNADKRNQLITQTLSNGITYRYTIDDDGIVHIYGKEQSVNIHDWKDDYGNTNATRSDSITEELWSGYGNDSGDGSFGQDGRESSRDDTNDNNLVSGKGRGNRTGRSKDRSYAHRNPKGWHFNDDGSVEVTYSDGTKETENAAPIKKTSSNDDVFFDASHDEKFSLSANGDTPKRYGRYNVYGKDIMLEQDVAPIGASVSNIEQEERGALSATTDKEYVGMDDFLNRDSSVWRNVDYNDDATKASIMKNTHEDMVKDGAIVVVADDVINSVKQSYPDLRGVKKNERTLRLREAMKTLKSNIRQFLSGLKDQSFDFEVNGKVLEARLYNTGINEVLEKVTQEKANMLYTSEEIFKNARYLYSTPDYGGDPNVYRWNYFYTPVQIGQETVGVRIAVRDVMQGQDHIPESQVYNWGIKKDASLGGVQPVVYDSSHGASSDASNNSIADFAPFVKPDEDTVSDDFAPTTQNIAHAENFQKRIESWDGITEGFAFVVGDTPSYLSKLEVMGKKVGNKQVRIDATKIKNIMKDHPEMTKDVIKNLPDLLNDPILVLDSKTVPGRLVLLGEVYANGKPVMMALELNPTTRSGKSTYVNVIKVASAYARQNVQNMISTSTIRYINKNKSRVGDWLKVNRLQLPLPNSQSNSANVSISETMPNVNSNSEKSSDIAPVAKTKVSAEAPYYGESEIITPSDPFENRDIKTVGNPKVKAYVAENPDALPFFQEAANAMLGDLQNTIKGERHPINDADGYIVGWEGAKRHTTDDIAYLLDNPHYTYEQIENGLKQIIEGNGKYNAVAKKIEFFLSDRLMNGYTDISGYDIPPNQEYLNLLRQKQMAAVVNQQVVESIEHISDDVAPVAETVAPVTENADVAPVKQTEEKPRKTAEILFEETEGRKKRGIWSLVKEYVLDNGMVFEDISKKHNRRELEARWNSIRNSEKAAQRFIANGKNGVKSIDALKNEIEQSGLIEDFNYYMYHKHNVDRMSLESRVAPKLAELKEQLGELDDAQIAELAEEKIRRGASAEDANRIRNAKVYTHLMNFKNKAVFGDAVTAEVSQAKVDAWEKEHPEFKEWAEEVYANNKLLRQFMVDNGILSEETAELWDSLYPHYVPIRRKNQDGAAINVPLDTNKTGINAPIKRATGGDSDFYDLFSTMSQRAIQTYKAVAKNRFGTELLDVLGTTVSQSEAGLNDAMDSVEDNDGLLKAGKHGANPTFTIFEDGKRVEFEISEEMYDAMRPAGDLLSYTNDVANKISNFRRATLTEYSALFLAKNAVKDMQDVFLNSQHAVRTYGAIPEAIKEMATGKGQYIQEYLDNGGEANTYFDSETNSFTEENKAWEAIKTVTGLNAVQKANNVVEMLPRLAEYIASRKMGRSIDVSMLDAARVTTNFAAGGKLTKMLNRNGATFLNASVQGAIQQVRNVREAKMNGLKGVLGLAAKVGLVGGTALLLNNLMWDDDEEYEELSDYVKQNYYIVGKFGDGKFVRIPKGRATAVIQNAFEQMQNLVTGNDEVDLKAFLDLAVSNLAPNDPIDNNVLSPIMQVKNNETWYGEDLVPSRLQKLPDAEQYDETTDSLSKWLGEKLDFSPYKINYLLDQYSGFVGDAVLPMLTPEAESGDMPIVGDIEQPWLKELAKLFVAPAYDAFTTDSTMKNQDVSDFYEMMDELTVGANASGATDEDILKSKYMNSINSELGELYAKKREIQNSNLSDAEKYEAVREVQKQITELAENSLNAYDNISIEEYSTHGVFIGEYANVGDRYFKRNKDGEWEKLDDKELSKFLATKDAGDSYYATDGENHYKWYEPSEDSDEKPSWKKISDDELERQEEVTSELGISASDYWGNKDEYTYAYKYPGKYAISKAVGGYDTYTSYTSVMNDIGANNDSSSGVKDKDLITEYIFGLDLDYGEKIILYRSKYSSKADKNEYNADIVDYLNSRDDISYEEMVTILEELDMTIGSDGYVYWD